ncbi:conserved oligomeric Golgi complex subunit 2 [Nephila pilipes]|uniref:Conserved oligomeric Golgi complex subunit 2 n=1 Tax=Nephila pilipes TaxID=299642 RepID=A0A8X6MEE6_NEPPI|nr:conserved oligomeric Golgi complex subunit 2 [Nephila pilipes]GFS76236.1 conserved oligomeric Golgi complex subunit 2 [Nephila pilipes]
MSEYKNPIDIHLKVKSLPSLCFNKDDFLMDDFCIDRFISQCRKHASLDTMRDDLNMYHKMLCTAMIELLNKDYTDFVNLSSNLAGLEKSLKNLSLPLQKLKDEIEITKTSLDETLQTVTKFFSERVSNHGNKVLIHHLLSVEEGLENINLLTSEKDHDKIQVLERVAFTFNNVQYHMRKITDLEDYTHKKEVLAIVAQNLEQQLQEVFLQNLSIGVSDNNLTLPSQTQDLQKILRIYSVIGEERKLENVFQISIVRPFMKKLVTQTNITKLGLDKLLQEILNFIPNACSDVLKLTTKGINKDVEIVPGYDFLVNAVWPEIINSFELISPVYLFSLGDPQQFHGNYCSVMRFLDQFEHLCEVQSSVIKFRKLSSYKEFIQKFNLDVYFQIRFQEIAGKFELDLFEDGFAKSNDKSLPYMLKATVSLWYCLNLCWSDTVFLPFLRNDFWKLTMQLLSRYNIWANSCIKEIKNKTLELALLTKDVETLTPDLKRFFLEIIQPKLCYGSVTHNTECAFQDAETSLREIPAVSAKLIVKILNEKCSAHLKMISSIPQRFRKTNREIPSKPSPYVSQVLNPLTEFSLEANSVLPSEWRSYIESQVTDAIMKQCVTLMQDVLTSIKKMEDSLKILKRARDKSTGQFSHGVVTDDDKIRRQLAIDVAYFEELIQKSDLHTSALKSLSELRDIIASADKIPGFPNAS